MDARFTDLPIYDLPAPQKTPLLIDALHDLTRHHAAHCPEYGRLLKACGIDPARRPQALADFLPLTVRQFKHHDLKSVPDEAVFKTLLSSGTSGQPSTIRLDRDGAADQTRVLVKIMQHWLGRQRLPMLIADHAGVIKDRARFSARGAGIQGMAMLGRDHTYALREDMSFDREAVAAFAERHGDAPVLLFGFTYMVWQYFVEPLIASGIRLPGGILLHGGGWKKLEEQAVDNAAFKARLAEAGIARVHNYYGMVEQTGAIFVECEHGHLHAPVHADVIIRDPLDDRELPAGQQGVIELLSALPASYPGHVLLTEDIGSLAGIDDCPCGRKGRYFHVHGRIPKAEARGCSDTFATDTHTDAQGLRLLAGRDYQAVSASTPLHSFAESATGFLGALSERLLKEPRYRAHPDLVALGFWLRPATLKALQQDLNADTSRLLKPAGVALHIAPSNVDTLFMYSWALSLLAGNANIVRLSSRETAQRAELLDLVNALLADDAHGAVRERTAIISYGHDDDLTAALSARCNRRIVWGGDNTVAHLRGIPLPPLAQEIVFPDRSSAALLDARAVRGSDDPGKLVAALYRDLYGFNQQACSSPRLLFWLGGEDDVAAAKARFWPLFEEHLKTQAPQLSWAELMDKRAAEQSLAMTQPVELPGLPDHRLDLVDADHPEAVREGLAGHPGGGLLLQVRIDGLAGLGDWFAAPPQTLTYHGVSRAALADWLQDAGGATPDRVVPLGQALNFDAVWDGIDLIRALSRTLTLR